MKIIKKANYWNRDNKYKEIELNNTGDTFLYNNIVEYINDIINDLNHLTKFLDNIENLEEEIIDNARHSNTEPGDDYYGRDYLSQSIPMELKEKLSIDELLYNCDTNGNIQTIDSYYNYLDRLKRDQENSQ